MSKIDRAIKAMQALPPDRREEVADMVLTLTDAVRAAPGQSALTPEQRDELRRRRANGFKPGDSDRIDALLARLK
ncbi:MAG: hypothetical protein AB7O04_13505 [Hyphomonadaceae bacterium]